MIDNKSFIDEKEQRVYDCKLTALGTNTIKSLGKSNKDKEIRQGTTMRKTTNTRPLKQSPSKQVFQHIYRSLNVLKQSLYLLQHSFPFWILLLLDDKCKLHHLFSPFLFELMLAIL